MKLTWPEKHQCFEASEFGMVESEGVQFPHELLQPSGLRDYARCAQGVMVVVVLGSVSVGEGRVGATDGRRGQTFADQGN